MFRITNNSNYEDMPIGGDILLPGNSREYLLLLNIISARRSEAVFVPCPPLPCHLISIIFYPFIIIFVIYYLLLITYYLLFIF